MQIRNVERNPRWLHLVGLLEDGGDVPDGEDEVGLHAQNKISLLLSTERP